MLKGKKTYLTALATILGTAAGVLTGQLTLPDAVQLAVTAIIGATLRKGIDDATTGQ